MLQFSVGGIYFIFLTVFCYFLLLEEFFFAGVILNLFHKQILRVTFVSGTDPGARMLQQVDNVSPTFFF